MTNVNGIALYQSAGFCTSVLQCLMVGFHHPLKKKEREWYIEAFHAHAGDVQMSLIIIVNTSHIIKRTRKMIKIDRNNALSRLKFDSETAKI